MLQQAVEVDQQLNSKPNKFHRGDLTDYKRVVRLIFIRVVCLNFSIYLFMLPPISHTDLHLHSHAIRITEQMT